MPFVALFYGKEVRKIAFLLLLSGLPHCEACFPLSWMFGAFIPLARLCPVAKSCAVQVLQRVAHLARLTSAKDRNSRSLSELLWTGWREGTSVLVTDVASNNFQLGFCKVVLVLVLRTKEEAPLGYSFANYTSGIIWSASIAKPYCW